MEVPINLDIACCYGKNSKQIFFPPSTHFWYGFCALCQLQHDGVYNFSILQCTMGKLWRKVCKCAHSQKGNIILSKSMLQSSYVLDAFTVALDSLCSKRECVSFQRPQVWSLGHRLLNNWASFCNQRTHSLLAIRQNACLKHVCIGFSFQILRLNSVVITVLVNSTTVK